MYKSGMSIIPAKDVLDELYAIQQSINELYLAHKLSDKTWDDITIKIIHDVDIINEKL